MSAAAFARKWLDSLRNCVSEIYQVLTDQVTLFPFLLILNLDSHELVCGSCDDLLQQLHQLS